DELGFGSPPQPQAAAPDPWSENRARAVPNDPPHEFDTASVPQPASRSVAPAAPRPTVSPLAIVAAGVGIVVALGAAVYMLSSGDRGGLESVVASSTAHSTTDDGEQPRPVA